jgi:hypothetical protein
MGLYCSRRMYVYSFTLRVSFSLSSDNDAAEHIRIRVCCSLRHAVSVRTAGLTMLPPARAHE